MSVPNGFKQTEVGVIPDDWEVSSLFEIVNVIDGDRGVNYPSKSDLKPIGYCLFLNAGNVTKEGFVFGKNEFIGKDKHISLHNGTLERNDIVLTTRGTVGNFAYFHHLIPFDIIRINSGMVILRADTTQCESSYLYCALTSNVTSNQIKQLSFGSAQPQLTVSGIKQILCPLPPTRAEQTAIAAALSDMDALIEGVEKLLEKKRRIKQGAIQELLRPKEGWKEVLLSSIADILTGFPFASSGYSNDGIKLLRGSNVKRGNIDWSKDNTKYWKYITNDIKNYELQAGDVVIAMDGSLVGKSFAQISEHDIPALLLQRVARIRTDKVDINYISHLVCGNYFTIHCEQIKTSSAIPHISPKDIRDFQIPLPPTRAEQATIAAILSDMDAEIEQLETQLTKYRQLKTGMMQELLTGKKRLV